MTKPNTTEIIVILDRSGSMQSVVADMQGGFDSFIKKQCQDPGETRVTLVQFDDKYEVVYTAVPIAKVPPLLLEPRGSTSLLDAMGRTITATGERLRSTHESERPEKVIVLVMTDGHENTSTEFTPEAIAEMTKRQAEQYQWQFVYLGADQDAFAVAKGIGIMRNAVRFVKTMGGIRAAFNATSESVSAYKDGANGFGSDLSVQQSAYDAELAKLQGGSQVKI